MHEIKAGAATNEFKVGAATNEFKVGAATNEFKVGAATNEPKSCANDAKLKTSLYTDNCAVGFINRDKVSSEKGSVCVDRGIRRRSGCNCHSHKHSGHQHARR
jgi:hypothetical protein